MGLNAGILRERNVAWSLQLQAARNSTEVQDLGSLSSLILPFGFLDQRDVVGFPIGALFDPEVVSAQFDDAGNVVNAMCRGGAAFSRGGGAPVPCAQANPVYRARYQHLTTRESNRFKPTQAQAVIAAAILRQLHAVVTRREAWNAEIAAGGRDLTLAA